MNKSNGSPFRKPRRLITSPQMLMFFILVLVVLVLFTFLTPNYSYIKISNLNNILTDSVIPAIFAFGMGIIIAGGGFDLSLGHIASMVASIVAYLMSGGIKFDPLTAITIGLITAAGIGTVSTELSGLFKDGSWGFSLAPQALPTLQTLVQADPIPANVAIIALLDQRAEELQKATNPTAGEMNDALCYRTITEQMVQELAFEEAEEAP